MDKNGPLHIAMLPWLAMGHLLPFFELSKRLALHGHHISFISTPRNLQRLPTLPPHLSPLISFIPLPLPFIEHLPPTAEATVDLPSDDLRPLLRKAFDSFHLSLPSLLRPTPPHWLLFDYAAHWAPSLAADLGIPSAFIGLPQQRRLYPSSARLPLSTAMPPAPRRMTSPSSPTGSPSLPPSPTAPSKPGNSSTPASSQTIPASLSPTATSDPSPTADSSPSGAATSSNPNGWISSQISTTNPSSPSAYSPHSAIPKSIARFPSISFNG
ncbi:hypothetical protein J5N97_022511 [Dioscorea zingiberensis]|uniref:Uncharacterized protein n=1 Tax=Dioscorea zingiberensis TaxID=325984 RepID=A0A9D5HAQ7_9LILI|nr:hypothetical protein J5N97_022511 [Dioscorea zingiberensis]